MARLKRMRVWRRILAGGSASLALLLASVAGSAARPASPDSLPELQRQFAAGRAADAASLLLARRVYAARAVGARRDSSGLAEAAEWLGRAHLARAEYAAAESLFAAALGWRVRAPRRDPAAEVRTLSWWAEGLRVTRQLARAESTGTAGLERIQALAFPETTTWIRLASTLGNARAERGDARGAIAALERATALSRAHARRDSLQLGQVLRNLGRAHAAAARVERARELYTEALRVQEAALGSHHPELATTLYLASMAAATIGDHVAALADADRALAIRERVFGPRHLVVAVALNAVGGARRELGDLPEATAAFERALAILDSLPRPSPFEAAQSHNNLANVLVQARDPLRALQHLDQARALRERAFGPGAGTTVWSQLQVARARWMAGDTLTAAALVAALIDGLPGVPEGDAVYQLADAHTIAASIQWARGRRDEATASYQRAFELERLASGPHSPPALDALADLAAVRHLTGDHRSALEDALRVEALSGAALRQTVHALAEHEALRYEQRRARGLDLALALALSPQGLAPTDRVRLGDALVRSRLPVLDLLAEEQRSLPRGEPELEAARSALDAARRRLATLLVARMRQRVDEDSAVTEARRTRDAAERTLASRSARYRGARQRLDAGWTEVAAALPPGTALVAYRRHVTAESMLGRDGPRRDMGAGVHYAALVQRAGEPAPRAIALGSASAIESAVSLWLRACATPPPSRALAAASERRTDALGRAVAARIWDPLAPAIAGAERVFVVPDGALHAVAFLALPAAGGGRLVEHGPVIHRLTAERDLLPPETAPRGSGLLVLGAVDFDGGSAPDSPMLAAAVPGGRREHALLRFEPLPGTGAEVADVLAQWRPEQGEATSLVGAAATEAAFRALAPGRRVLHLATHGFALAAARDPASMPGRRAVGGVLQAGEATGPRSALPVLPGLALAGANRVEGRAEGDGFLTAEEVTALDLRDCEWAVLSACETGHHDASAAEAVQGLQRAFRRAGARTVVMSLWAVDDAATQEGMRALYAARFGAGLSTDVALRTACRQVLAARRARGLDTHPFHWAGFVAAGDWR